MEKRLSAPVHYRIGASCFYFIQGLTFATWTSRIPDVRRALGLSDGELGMVLLSMPAGQISAMALSGFLVGRFGSCRMARVAVLIFPALLVPVALAGSAGALAALLFLFGMASNLSNIAINTQCVGVERLYGRSIMVSFHGLWSFAGLTGVVLSMAMVAMGVSIFWHFLMVEVVTLLIFGANAGRLLPRDHRVAGEGESGKGFAMERYILILGVIGFGCLACEGAMYNWCAVYFESVIRPSADWVRVGYVGYMLAITCCRFAADRFVRRWGPEVVLRVSGGLIAGGMVMLTSWPGMVVSTVGCMVIGLGTGAVVPICYSLAGRSKKVKPSVAIATVSTVAFLGFLVAPPAVGLMAEGLNLRWAMGLMGAFAFATTLLVCKLKKAA